MTKGRDANDAAGGDAVVTSVGSKTKPEPGPTTLEGTQLFCD